jgi:hypothetical protein
VSREVSVDVSCRPVGILTISFVSLVLGLPTGNFLETSLARRVANTVPPGPFFEFKRNLPANDMERISFFLSRTVECWRKKRLSTGVDDPHHLLDICTFLSRG